MKQLAREVRRHEHDDRLLDLVGGLASTIARLDALLARYAPAGSEGPSTCAPAGSEGPSTCAPDLVDAVLGAIAIRNRLAAAFEAAAMTGEPAPPATAEPAPPHGESLLR